MKDNKSKTFILDDNDNDALPLIKPIVENEEELREKALQRKNQIEEMFKDDSRRN